MNNLKKTAIQLSVLCGINAFMTFTINDIVRAAVLYDITDLSIDLSNNGYSLAIATDINDAGQIVGPGVSIGRTQSGGLLWSSNGIIELDKQSNGNYYTSPQKINNLGQVVGSYYTPNRESAFLWSDSTGIFDLGIFPGGNYSKAQGINDMGQVVGFADTRNQTYRSNGTHAFLWSNNTGMIDLGTLPGGDYSEAYGINNLGQVVGTSNYTENFLHAFLWSSNTGMIDLGTLQNGEYSRANSINNVGQVVGTSTLNRDDNADGDKDSRAFVWSSSTGMIDLGIIPGRYNFTANDINDAGQIVGEAAKNEFDRHAFVWTQSHGMVDLNTLIDPNSGWTLWGATAINNKGQIVGYGTYQQSYDYRAFLLTPKSAESVPEPSITISMIFFGLFTSYLYRRH
ncbi:MAG TPA: DUF3466 family protein [Leptolyngbyaceae cyanobacterium]